MHNASDAKAVFTHSPDDILWGASDIGRYLNCSSRRSFYLLERGLIPARKVGNTWVATKPELNAAVRGEQVAA